ncbi:MAG: hypothetical protein U5L96_05495 [Owenweeksia sp.]|nr:hypothetical protein [Owenweeksia sp.]
MWYFTASARIGRLAARQRMAQEGKGEQLRLRAIVTRGEPAESLGEKSFPAA